LRAWALALPQVRETRWYPQSKERLNGLWALWSLRDPRWRAREVAQQKQFVRRLEVLAGRAPHKYNELPTQTPWRWKMLLKQVTPNPRVLRHQQAPPRLGAQQQQPAHLMHLLLRLPYCPDLKVWRAKNAVVRRQRQMRRRRL